MTDMIEAQKQALIANPYRQARFVTIEFPDYTMRAWTGVGTRTLDGEEFTGVGRLGSIAPITDRADLSSQRLSLTLSGLESTYSAEVQQYVVQGSPVRIVQAQIDDNDQIIAGSFEIFYGEVDTPSETFGDTYTISLQVENYLSFMFRGPDGRRRTGADQEQIFNNSGDPDHGFQFVGYLLMSIPWGVKSSITQKTGGTSSGMYSATNQAITS